MSLLKWPSGAPITEWDYFPPPFACANESSPHARINECVVLYCAFKKTDEVI